MSKKMRIIISCMLVVLAFGAGALTYARAYGDKVDEANAEGTAYFVDSNHNIQAPPGGTDYAAKMSRGTETNPLFIIELVPYEGYAEFGYHISGAEPIDVEAASRDGYALGFESVMYNATVTPRAYWASEVPDSFKTAARTNERTTKQCGIMTYVGAGYGTHTRTNPVYEYVTAEADYTGTRYRQDGSNYIIDDAGTLRRHTKSATYTPDANGDFKWEPLTALECLALESNYTEQHTYETAYQDVENIGDSFRMMFTNVTYYLNEQSRTLTHKNEFLLESVGLAYKFDSNGKRIKNTNAAEVAAKVAAYKTVVYTVTPEELNMNLHLIDRADMIVVSAEKRLINSDDENIWSKYKKPELFTHLDTKKLNKSDATFINNPLDWGAVLKIYERATDPERICPVIFDTKSLNSMDSTSVSTTLKKTFGDGSVEDKNDSGVRNNMYKLILLLGQMKNATFEMFHGELTYDVHPKFSQVALDGTTKKLDGTPVMTGVFNYTSDTNSKYAKSKEYWSRLTFLPWSILPNSTIGRNSDNYKTIFSGYEIMSDAGLYLFQSGGMQNSIRGGSLIYDGDNKLYRSFTTQKALNDDHYGYEVYDYFESIGVTFSDADPLSMADCLYYLLNGVDAGGVSNEVYKILEIQPYTNGSKTLAEWKLFVSSYANSNEEPIVEVISTPEIIGKNLDFLSEYDLIYVGMNKLPSDGNPTMWFDDGNSATTDTQYVYSHTGPVVKLPESRTAMFGWLYTKPTLDDDDVSKPLEKQFAMSGNDITKLVRNQLMAYATAGYPILFTDGFFNTDAPAASDAVNTIDRNSYIYDLAEKIGETSYMYEGSLRSTTGTVHAAEASALRTAMGKSTEIKWTISSRPNEYNVDASEINCAPDASDYLSSDVLQYEFSLKAPAGKNFKVKLYIDANGDGKYAGDEMIASNVSVYNVTDGKSENGNLVGGKTYRVSRQVQDRTGSVSWKLALVDAATGNTVYQSLSGISAIKATEKTSIKVLQIMSNNRRTVFLPEDGECTPGGSRANIPSGELSDLQYQTTADKVKEVTQWFYEDTRDLEDFDITFVRMTENEVKTALADPQYLLKNYDMVVLGFADAYNGVSDDTVMNAVEAFRISGKALLYTHDTSSLVGYSTSVTLDDNFAWGGKVTERFRDAFGMDRYDVLGYKAVASVVSGRADVPYKPSSSSSNNAVLKPSGSGGNSYMLAQGMTNGALYRFAYKEDLYLKKYAEKTVTYWPAYSEVYKWSGSDGNLETTRISRVNQGGLTEYPYTIGSGINVGVTHTQYYQLDMEHPDIVVWYCLANASTTSDYVDLYYGATPNDVRNNYYIYNIGNVTYSGMGHRGDLTREEVRLFINTFIAAYRASAKSVSIDVENIDVTGDATKGYYLTVDVIQDAANDKSDKIMMNNDAQPGYHLQEAVQVGGVFQYNQPKADMEKNAAGEYIQAKRVFFKISDANTYATVEYGLKFIVNGTETELAVYKQSDNSFVDHSLEKAGGVKSDINKSTVGETYYVDVPVTVEVSASGTAIIDTKVEVEVVAKYKLSETAPESFETLPETTEVTVTPRGFFDLD